MALFGGADILTTCSGTIDEGPVLPALTTFPGWSVDLDESIGLASPSVLDVLCHTIGVATNALGG